MTARANIVAGALVLRVEEESPGLYFWTVTQGSPTDRRTHVCIDASDHPYPTHDAALQVGAACLRAYRATANGIASLVPSHRHTQAANAQ